MRFAREPQAGTPSQLSKWSAPTAPALQAVASVRVSTAESGGGPHCITWCCWQGTVPASGLHQQRVRYTSGLYLLLPISLPTCYPGRNADRRLEISGVKCFWPTFLL